MRNFFRTLAPEKFDAKVEIRADGSYAYSYDGVLIFVPALMQAERGALDARTEAQLKEAAMQLRREGFRRADYLGGGRYAVLLERSCAKGEPSFFPSREMKVFSIKPQPDGAIAIGGSRPDATAPCQLAGTNAEIDGKLIVILEKGMDALRHNAHNKRSVKGHDEYQWRIKSPEDDPFMITGTVSPVEAGRQGLSTPSHYGGPKRCRSRAAQTILALTTRRHAVIENGAKRVEATSSLSIPKWGSFTEHPEMGLTDVYAAVIPDFPYRPGVHVHYQVTKLPIKDGLPKMKDLPKEMGGSGVQIAE